MTKQAVQPTAQLLEQYSRAAISNARELLEEATLLLRHEHWARAYFLSVACIEETGKSLLAFDAQNRKLSNPAVVSKLFGHMRSHPRKISYAFKAWISRSKNLREPVEAAVRFMTALRNGREPAMYSDCDMASVQMPREVVSSRASVDCVRLAHACMTHAVDYLSRGIPPPISSADDALFTMNMKDFESILSSADFWWFYLDRREKGADGWTQGVLDYHQQFYKSTLLFRPPVDVAHGSD